MGKAYMFNPKYTLTQTMIQNLARIEVIKQSFETISISPRLLASLRETAKVSSVHYSTRIEGNRLTKEEVKGILHNKHLPAKQRDEKEVKAYYDAFMYVESALVNGKTLSEYTIFKIHDLVEGQKKSIPYRDSQNAIYDSVTGAKIYLPPEAKEVPLLMKELIEWIVDNQSLSIPLLAGIIHYQFVTIHPYYDGNGRTARLLTTFIMRQMGYDLKGIYSLEEYYANNLMAYYDALQTHPHHNYYYGRDKADITGWLEYFIGGVKEAFENVYKQSIKLPHAETNVDTSMRELNIKQRRTLELFVHFKEINSTQVAEALHISAGAARALMREFMAVDFIIPANKSRKARTYILTEKYQKLLQ